MGQDDILNEILAHGEVPQSVLNTKFRNKGGQLSRQLKSLRDKNLAVRRLVKRQWIYSPTKEALKMEVENGNDKKS